MKRLRLRKIIAKIKKNPKCWDQAEWHCGTSHCIAGHAQIEAGKYKQGTPFDSDVVRKDAKKYLDINERQAFYLFGASRRLEQIEQFEEDDGELPIAYQ